MCETETARVRGPILDTSSSGSQTTSSTPTNSHVRVIAPYSCPVIRISSPGCSGNERMTAFSPDVALGTKTRSSGRAPTNAASAARASASLPGRSSPPQNQRAAFRVKKSVGPDSSSRWIAWYSSNTGTGHAPKLPWFRCVDFGIEKEAVAHVTSLPPLRGVLRTYFPPLPRSVTTLQVGGLVNAFGNGITLPFLFIYLHNVRGIGLGIVGLIVGSHAVASIVAGPVFGAQIDRFGGRRLLATALAILAGGYALYPLVHEPWQGFLVAAITGIGVGGFWPSQSTLIAGLTPAEQRPAAFAMQRVVMNLGIGLGALAGGLIATTEKPGSFTVLFLLNSLTFVVYAAVMLALVPSPSLGAARASRGRPAPTATSSGTGRSWP